MIKKIEKDYNRFRQIILGKIKHNLKDYIKRGEFIGKKGKDIISIPVPQIEIPTFKYAEKKMGGVGEGDGKIGKPIGTAEGDKTPGAGSMPGRHIYEVDITLKELAELLGDELELPNIEPRGKDKIIEEKDEYFGVRRTGPETLRVFKRTYKEALKRQIMSDIYDPENPVIIPIRDDKRYRSWRVKKKPQSNALIIYIMDVSGSMEDEQKEIVRIESFWIDTWLRSQYKGVESVYIIHCAEAREVDEETFYHTRVSGGTMISTAYKLSFDIINKRYKAGDWNIYHFQFTDGDNWEDDNEVAIELLRDSLLPKSNLFCYGQVESPYSNGDFINLIHEQILDRSTGQENAITEKLVTSIIHDREGIYNSIKDFLGRGR